MSHYSVDWDNKKGKANLRKHGVTFEEAATAFEDRNALVNVDEAHSADEERFILIGFSKKSRLLIVCHCVRKSETVIRIISARKANKTERKQYGDSL